MTVSRLMGIRFVIGACLALLLAAVVMVDTAGWERPGCWLYWVLCVSIAGMGSGVGIRGGLLDRAQPWRLPRFRLHALMVAVALFGLIFAGGIRFERMSRKIGRYRLEAINSALFEETCRGAARR